MSKHLILSELANAGEEVDAFVNSASFMNAPVRVGDLIDHDEVPCKVLQTYHYTGEADFSFTLAIVYPPELEAPEQEDWWCNSTKKMEEVAGRPYYQTRHIWISERTRNIFSVYPSYDWDNDLEPDSDDNWQIKTCHKFTCSNSPVGAIYVAMCEKRALVAA